MMDHIRHPPLVCGLLTCMACREYFYARQESHPHHQTQWVAETEDPIVVVAKKLDYGQVYECE